MVTVVLPTYNERENIIPLLTRLVNLVDEIIVVDDNSPDGTGLLAQSFGGNVRTITRTSKMGLSSAVVQGVHEAKDDNIIVMDADLSHPPEIIPVMKDALTGHDIVIASRNSVVGWGIQRRLMSGVANFLAQALYFKWKIRDPMSGFFGIKRAVFEEYGGKVSPRGYKILFAITKHYIHDHECSGITNIDYTFINRKYGSSKLSMNEIMDYLRSLFGIEPSEGKKTKKAFFGVSLSLPDLLSRYSSAFMRRPIIM